MNIVIQCNNYQEKENILSILKGFCFYDKFKINYFTVKEYKIQIGYNLEIQLDKENLKEFIENAKNFCSFSIIKQEN